MNLRFCALPCETKRLLQKAGDMAEKVAYSPFCWIINDDALAASEDAGNARDARAFELK